MVLNENSFTFQPIKAYTIKYFQKCVKYKIFTTKNCNKKITGLSNDYIYIYTLLATFKNYNLSYCHWVGTVLTELNKLNTDEMMLRNP